MLSPPEFRVVRGIFDVSRRPVPGGAEEVPGLGGRAGGLAAWARGMGPGLRKRAGGLAAWARGGVRRAARPSEQRPSGLCSEGLTGFALCRGTKADPLLCEHNADLPSFPCARLIADVDIIQHSAQKRKYHPRSCRKNFHLFSSCSSNFFSFSTFLSGIQALLAL